MTLNWTTPSILIRCSLTSVQIQLSSNLIKSFSSIPKIYHTLPHEHHCMRVLYVNARNVKITICSCMRRCRHTARHSSLPYAITHALTHHVSTIVARTYVSLWRKLQNLKPFLASPIYQNFPATLRRPILLYASSHFPATMRQPIPQYASTSLLRNMRRARFRAPTVNQIFMILNKQTMWSLALNDVIAKLRPRNGRDTRDCLCPLRTHVCEMLQYGTTTINSTYSTTRTVVCRIFT